MAFGFSMRVELNDRSVLLRPPTKEEMGKFADYFGLFSVVRYTNMWHAPTQTDEEEWWEKVRKDKTSVHWSIIPECKGAPVGMTGLNGLNPISGSCTSGIMIGDKDIWGQGYAGLAHIGRTLAADYLNRATIQSHVRCPNEASLKALMRVGYRVTGFNDRDNFVGGEYVDTYNLSWVNPRFVPLLYPDGAPDYLMESLEKARRALELASQVVTLM